ncbi:MAG: protein translocase subunit SecD [Deltaproteobacteria bacterium]|nr:protein translocase subunit SecD [Deltaproteobacteria bacterium]
MEKIWYWKIAFTFALVLAAAYYALGSMPEEWQPTFVNTNSRIVLGLDLQGGVRLVYEIDVGKAYSRRTEGYAISARQWAIREAGVAEDKVRTERLGNRRFALNFEEPVAKAEELGSNFERVLKFDGCDEAQTRCLFTLRSEVLESEREVSSAGVLKVIRERVDQHGLTEPNIAAQGMDIVVEVPQRSIEDVNRVKEIISKTASLEFRIVSRESYVDPSVTDYILNDPRFQGKVSLYTRGGGRHLEAQDTEAQSGREILQQLIEAFLVSDVVQRDPVKASQWGRVYVGTQEGPALGSKPGQAGQAPNRWRTYLLEPEIMVTGDRVVNAAVRYDPDAIRDQIYVILDFDSLGGEQFGDATEKNVHRDMAIVLDGIVRSAPNIIEPIKGGTCRITLGAGSPDELKTEAEDLVTVLKAGALPAPLKQPPAAESKIGPSLGRESIRQGLLAAGVGLFLVVAFMGIYYKMAGVFADVALVLNMLFMIGALALLGATLTLPGITGFVLTMGMAVDANVIINERIREELRAGKSPRAAVDTGYARAFWTIFDSQLTTFFAGVVLFQFGTGPIQGFAVTLMIGIASSMFTGIFVTRLFFDYITHKKRPATLSV